jgi:hypothetical protein
LKALHYSRGNKYKQTRVKPPLAVSELLEWVHQFIMVMLCPSKLNMAYAVRRHAMEWFLTDVAWIIYSSYHTVPKASPEVTSIGWNMVFKISFINTGNTKQIATHLMKHAYEFIWIAKLVQGMQQNNNSLNKPENWQEGDIWTMPSEYTDAIIRI